MLCTFLSSGADGSAPVFNCVGVNDGDDVEEMLLWFLGDLREAICRRTGIKCTGFYCLHPGRMV